MKITYLKNVLSEDYFKSIDDLKKTIDKKHSADDIRKQSKEILLEDIIENVDLEAVYSICSEIFKQNIYAKKHDGKTSPAGLFNINRYSKYIPDVSKIPIFLILTAEYMDTEYFGCRLSNFTWNFELDENDFITKEKTYIKIIFKYVGEMTVIESRENVYGSFNDSPAMISPHSWSWPNPDIDYIKEDLKNLRKYLESIFPGVCFEITFTMLATEGDTPGRRLTKYDFNFTKRLYTLAKESSDENEVVNKYLEMKSKKNS